MTHNQEVKNRLLWSENQEWYGHDPDKGFYLKACAPPKKQEIVLGCGRCTRTALAKKVMIIRLK